MQPKFQLITESEVAGDTRSLFRISINPNQAGLNTTGTMTMEHQRMPQNPVKIGLKRLPVPDGDVVRGGEEVHKTLL